MQRITWVLLGLTWLASSCRSVDPKAETAATSLDDGVYPVVTPADAGTSEGASALTRGVVELKTVPVKDEPVESILVLANPVVRLREMHVTGAQLDETNSCQLITFKNDERLKRFSREHVGSRLAVVIGGKVVSSHKVRVPLEGEEFQISFCTEGGGDHLYKHLRQVTSYLPERHKESG
jgi:preprotein translocase subunit SecD